MNMPLLNTNLAVASLEHPDVAQYYRTDFVNERQAFEAQLAMANVMNPDVRMNTIKLSNLTLPTKTLKDIGKLDLVVRSHRIVRFSQDKYTVKRFTTDEIFNLRCYSTCSILINVPTWCSSFLDYWFTVFKNSNLTVWFALPSTTDIDEHSRYDYEILHKQDLTDMVSFSRVMSCETAPVKYSLYKLRFSPTITSVRHAFSLAFDMHDYRLDAYSALHHYVTKLSKGSYGKLIFYLINRSAHLTHNPEMINSRTLEFIGEMQINVNAPPDPTELSISGLSRFMHLISLGEFSLPPFSLVVEIFNRYLPSLSGHETIDYNVCLTCFFASHNDAIDICKFFIATESRFLCNLLKDYRYSLIQSLDIYNSFDNREWADSYVGEGFESILVALYVARFHECYSYGEALTYILSTTMIYCSCELESSKFEELQSLKRNDQILWASDKLFIADPFGELYGPDKIRVSRYNYIINPETVEDEDNNLILSSVVHQGLGQIRYCEITLPDDAVFCNSVLGTSFDHTNFSPRISLRLRSMHKLATYFAYFPNRTFDREVMYVGRKNTYCSSGSMVFNFRSKLTTSTAVISKSLVTMAVHNSNDEVSKVVSWYQDYKFYEKLDDDVLVYPARYFKCPLKIEEYVQHRGFGYASPIDGLNRSAFTLISQIGSVLSRRFSTSINPNNLFLSKQMNTLRNRMFARGPHTGDISEHPLFVGRLKILQSLPFRHVLTHLINVAYHGTPHILFPRPLVVMAVQTAASSTIKTANGDNFNIHHSYTTEGHTPKVEFVCRVCGNVGTTQYIVRMCEFVNSMDVSNITLNDRFWKCYKEEYLDYDNYSSSNPIRSSRPIKSLRSLRGPTDLRKHVVTCDHPAYTTATNLESTMTTYVTSLSAGATIFASNYDINDPHRFDTSRPDLTKLYVYNLPLSDHCDYFDILSSYKYEQHDEDQVPELVCNVAETDVD